MTLNPIGLRTSLDTSVASQLGTKASAKAALPQVRVTFTSSEVGNGSTVDSDTMANQDGGLAVRLQLENGSGNPFGPIVRTGDEGVSFDSQGLFTFDVRDLVSGVQRGDGFQVVTLGTMGNDVFEENDETVAYYINAGMGHDHVTGGRANDFLVGGAGDDMLSGGDGRDSFIGGGGHDHILGGSGNDLAILNLATDGADQTDLGLGIDSVNIAAPAGVQQLRLTFTSSEVGNRIATDSKTMANQDGGLAVRLQAEDGAGNVTGVTNRLDDEGITFVSTSAGVTFDVRDLVSGVQRGDSFSTVVLGTNVDNRIDKAALTTAVYVNAGQGNDRVGGGRGNDFLVGGLGDDRLNGRRGEDALLGGAGADVFEFSQGKGTERIIDFLSGTDKIDLRALPVDFGDIQSVTSGADTLVRVNTDADATMELEIRLVAAAAPVQSDFLFD